MCHFFIKSYIFKNKKKKSLKKKMLKGEMTLGALKKDLKSFLMDPNDYVFIKKLGSGGFGDVLLYRQKSTGIEVALKKSKQEMDEDLEKYYCREVRILSKTDNPFLLSLIGFTPEPPYIIITRFIKNGCLFDYLKKDAKKRLTPTQKTIIAMGIAHGMARFHELGLIHRDLKSLNILLDENYYPIICDFGISRDNELTGQTKQLGTPLWMAPEVLAGLNYNNLCDVYSYAMILYELIAERYPYNGIPPHMLIYVIANEIRPDLPPDTPEGLKQLVEAAWDTLPSNRPSFARIYAMFEAKIAYFAGTDLDAVDRFISYIRNSAGKKTTPDEITFEAIIDPVHPISPQGLANYIQKMNFNQCIELVEQFVSHLKKTDVTPAVRFTIYDAILQIVSRGGDYIKIPASANVPSVLTFDNSISDLRALELLEIFLRETPEFCPVDMLKGFVESQIKKQPHHIIYILSLYFAYVLKTPEIQEEQTIFEFFSYFISLCPTMLECGEIPDFLRVVAYVMKNSEILSSIIETILQSEIDKIFNADLNTEETRNKNAYAIHCCYRFIMEFPSFIVPPEAQESHSRCALLRPILASYALRNALEAGGYVPSLPIKLSTLVKASAKHNDVRTLILLYARNPKGALAVAKCSDCWKYNERVPPIYYLRLFLTVSLQPKCLKTLLSSNDIFVLFSQLSELHVPELSNAICTILRKIPSEYITQERIQCLEENGFWGHTIKCLMNSDAMEDQRECLSVIAFHGPTYVTKHMAQIYSYLKPLIQDDNPLCLHALAVMSPFMEIPPVKQKFESKGIVTAVQHLNVTPKNQDYIYNILSYYKK